MSKRTRIRNLALAGTSGLALASLGGIAASAAAQSVPDSALCPVSGTVIECSGLLSGGFDVPVGDRDKYTRLLLRNLTGPINAATADGVAVDFVNLNQPVSIEIDAPGVTISSTPALVTNLVASNVYRAFGVRGQTNGDISIVSNADIVINALLPPGAPGNASLEAAGLMARPVADSDVARNITVRNAGSITMNTTELYPLLSGIYVGFSPYERFFGDPGARIGTALIENTGTITMSRGVGIHVEDLDYGMLDVVNSGTIRKAPGMPDNDVITGIRVDFNADTRVRVHNTGSLSGGIEVIGDFLGYAPDRDGSVLVINDGTIHEAFLGITVNDYDAGEIDPPADVAFLPGWTRTIVNSGTIETGLEGITLHSSLNRVVRNSGTISVNSSGALNPTGVNFEYETSTEDVHFTDFHLYNPIGKQTLFENEAAGLIRVIGLSTDLELSWGRGPMGVRIKGGDPVVRNAGGIYAEGPAATGLMIGPTGDEGNAAGVVNCDIHDHEGEETGCWTAVTGTVDINNSGSIEAVGQGSTGVLVARYLNEASDTYDTTLVSSGLISASGDGGIGIRHQTRPRPPVVDDEFELRDDPGADPALAFLGHSVFDLTATSVVRGGSGTGAGIVFEGGASHLVRNAGLITAASGVAIIGGVAAETIDNSGRIEGTVSLGAGEDRVISRGGVFTGLIDGGTGTDVLQIEVTSGVAALADRIQGGFSNFELYEKTGAGTLSMTAPAFPRLALRGGTLATTGDLFAMAVDAEAGTTIEGTGRLGAVTLADGATLAPGGSAITTLELASLSLAATSVLRFDLGAPGIVGGTESDLINVTGNLILDGFLNVNALPGFGEGLYRIFNYGGTLTDNGLLVGALPGGLGGTIQTSIANQVNLIVGTGTFWDGNGAADDGVISGGSGVWSNTASNWTNAGGTVNTSWTGQSAIFHGAPGTVTIDPAGVAATGLQFAVNGYRIEGGALTLNAPGTIRVGDGSAAGSAMTATIASVITGAGGIAKTDLGTLILTAANTYTGGTTLSGGTVQIAADSALGAASGGIIFDGGVLRLAGALTSARSINVAPAGGLLDAGANAVTLSGAFSGTGDFSKIGSGALTFSGDGAGYSGLFTLAGGSMRLDSTLGGTLRVDAGARLGGTGTLGDLIVAGTLAPGNSIGTLSATGDVTFLAGSIFEVELSACGCTDRLVAGGTATIEGGTVRLLAIDPAALYANGTRYTFLTATDGVSGTFTGFADDSAFLDFTLGYTATSAYVDVQVALAFPDVAASYNQLQAAAAMGGLSQTPGSDSLAVYNSVLLYDADSARSLFNAVSGEIYAAAMASEQRHGLGLADSLVGRAYLSRAKGWSAWIDGGASEGTTDADGNGGKVERDSATISFGLSYRDAASGWSAGATIGYGDSDVTLADRASRASGDRWHVGGYVGLGDGAQGLSATLSGVYLSGEAEIGRVIALDFITRGEPTGEGCACGPATRVATLRGAQSTVETDTFALVMDLRYGFDAGDGWTVGPALRLAYADTTLGAFSEVGADSLNLSGIETGHDRFTAAIGGFARWEGEMGLFDLTLAYRTGGDNAAEARLALAGADATPFSVRAAEGGGHAAFVSASTEIRLGEGWQLGAGLATEFADGDVDLQGYAALRLRF